MTKQSAINKLNRIADRLIPEHGDPSPVSRSFGYGKDEQSSRVQAGVICRLLANQLWEEMVNEPR